MIYRCNYCLYNNTDKCNSCIENKDYSDKFEPKALEDNECICLQCKGIFTDRIFRFKDKPREGICFDCY